MEKLEKERLEREEQQRLEAQRKTEEIERKEQEAEKRRDQPVQQSEVVSSFFSTIAQVRMYTIYYYRLNNYLEKLKTSVIVICQKLTKKIDTLKCLAWIYM